MTVVIQIGNSDDKLSQVEWSQFVRRVSKLVDEYGEVHFSGHSTPDAPWQNACWVVEVEEDQLGDLTNFLTECRMLFKQDSVAMTCGQTAFI
jgi:hypothetical protein